MFTRKPKPADLDPIDPGTLAVGRSVAVAVPDPTRDVLDEVYAERAAQNAKWGEQNHPDGTGNVDQQRYAEFRRKWCQDAFGAGYGTWADVLAEEVAEAEGERDPARLRAELVQVAAVAVAWCEAIDRRTAAQQFPEIGQTWALRPVYGTRTVTVTEVTGTYVAYEWGDDKPGQCGSACPMDVFLRRYQPAGGEGR
jgi:hypothetical protein